MIQDFSNPSEVAQKRRQEAIERINRDIQAQPSSTAELNAENKEKNKQNSADESAGYIAADGKYIPNRIALKTRVSNALLSLGIIIYGYWGVHRDDLIIPLGKRTTSHFHNFSALIMYAAMLCASAHLAAIVVDHYDRRNNEHLYQRFGELSRKIGWGLFGIAFIVGLTHHHIDFR